MTQNITDPFEQIKKDAEYLTKKRLEDSGFDFHKDKEDSINEAEKVFNGTHSERDLGATHGTGETDPTSPKQTEVGEAQADSTQTEIDPPKVKATKKDIK